MRPLEHYFVQPVLEDGTVDTSRNVTIAATSPLKAGETALGRPLSLEGQLARAVVWRLTADFVPHSLTLYEAAQMPEAVPAS